MSIQRLRTKVEAIDSWGKRPVYRARIINTTTDGIVVKSGRVLEVGKRISFATLSDLEALGRKPDPKFKWRSGVIWRIDKGCLHLTRT
jgi:hypothetical protein